MMNSLNRISTSGVPSLNLSHDEPLQQNSLGNSDGVSVILVSNSSQYAQGQEIGKAIEARYPDVTNLTNFSESMTTSSEISASLEGRVALSQPRGLNRDLEEASKLLEKLHSVGSSSQEIAHAASVVRKIITRATIQLAATSNDSLEEPKDERVKTLIEDNELIRDMLKAESNNQTILNVLQDVLMRAQNLIGNRNSNVTLPSASLQGEGIKQVSTHESGGAQHLPDIPDSNVEVIADSGSEWGQYDHFSTPSSRGSMGSNNTSGDENELVRSPSTQDLQGLANDQNEA